MRDLWVIYEGFVGDLLGICGEIMRDLWVN